MAMKGWNTIDFQPAPCGAESSIFRVCIWGRKLEIVLKDKPLRVHVNPKVGGLDKWVYGKTCCDNWVYSDDDKYMLIGSPLEAQGGGDTKGRRRADMWDMLASCTAGGEKGREDDGIPAVKKQKTSWLAPGAASSKEPDPDEHTPQKAGNTAHEKLGGGISLAVESPHG